MQFHIDPLLLFPITKARRFPRGTVIPDLIQLSALSPCAEIQNQKSIRQHNSALYTLADIVDGSRHYHHRAYVVFYAAAAVVLHSSLSCAALLTLCRIISKIWGSE